MKRVNELQLGFRDAENYQNRQNKELFNNIFVRNKYLDELLEPTRYFLIGEKGTGKTAYSVFLSNNRYKNNKAELKYIRETDYQKFVKLKNNKHLELSDYESIWRVIILLLLAKSIDKDELDHNPFSKSGKMKALLEAIDSYYMNAFSPEIISVLKFIEDSKVAAEVITKYLKISGENSLTTNFEETKFQMNLFYIQRQFEQAISNLKVKENHILFIDGIDIRPGQIPYNDYLDCVKGLSNAVWSLNCDFFSNLKSEGRFRVVLLLRPDIFDSIGLQNQTNKIRDNSVYLDWRTTFPAHRDSMLFTLTDRLLSSQQDEKHDLGASWDYYFPWNSRSTNRDLRTDDPSFICLLRLCYSRPRDILAIMQIMQEEYREKKIATHKRFESSIFYSYDFKTKYSEYLMGGIKDQLSFYYDNTDYEIFLRFFQFLEGKNEFDYAEYINVYNIFVDYLLENYKQIPEFVESADSFLQFLYNSNIISYKEQFEYGNVFIRWCYRERSPSNISPKVLPNTTYKIHEGLEKALNVGRMKRK